MAFPERLLAEGETVLWHRRRHWSAAGGAMVVLPAASLLAGVGAGLIEQYLAVRWQTIGIGAVAAVYVLVVSIWVVLPWLRWRGTQVALTDRRVLLREGIVDRRGAEIALWEIVSVQTHRSWRQRLSGSGTVVIHRVSGPAIGLPHTARPAALAAAVTEALPPLPVHGADGPAHYAR